jgi:glycosidase
VSTFYDTGGVITADYFEGHNNLITLNHSSARVQEYVREVMLHWLRRGIDGWRLDAAYAVPAKFWAAVLPAVREEFPDAWFVGEMIHGDYIDYVKSSGLDSVTEYELCGPSGPPSTPSTSTSCSGRWAATPSSSSTFSR